MKNYSYNVAWSEADEEYVATSSEFAGLSALADTPEEAVRELHAAIDVAIDAYRTDGEPIPQPQFLSDFSGQFRLRIPKSQHAALSSRAEAEGVSLNTMVQSYISAGLAGEYVSNETASRLDLAIARTAAMIVNSVLVGSDTTFTQKSPFSPFTPFTTYGPGDNPGRLT
jgi:predicted RNase H-like HicB family nuclease